MQECKCALRRAITESRFWLLNWLLMTKSWAIFVIKQLKTMALQLRKSRSLRIQYQSFSFIIPLIKCLISGKKIKRKCLYLAVTKSRCYTWQDIYTTAYSANSFLGDNAIISTFTIITLDNSLAWFFHQSVNLYL